jgi:hypothetical protein
MTSGHTRSIVARLVGTVGLVAALAAPLALAQESTPLFGTDGDDLINGSAGPDAVYARAGNDRVNGAGGNDELDGGPGADILSGGADTDAMSYSTAAAVTVTLDGAANDGVVGEGDNVMPDVEDVYGGDGNDKLTGDAASNTLDGGAGDDTVEGASGHDALFGGEGDDTIRARDGVADQVDCGPGSDTAFVDAVDKVVGCETKVALPVTPDFVVNFKPGSTRVLSINVLPVRKRSRVVIACASGCRPPSRKPVAQRKSATLHGTQVTLRLPARPEIVAGAVFEVGVTAPGLRTRCTAFRVGRGLLSLARLKSRCRTVARN